MLKGWSLMGDALAHSIVPGVAGAYILGAALRGWRLLRRHPRPASAMQFVKQNSRAARGRRNRRSSSPALVRARPFDGVDLGPTSVWIQTIVLGNILAIADEDVVQVAIISVVSLRRPCSSCGRT